VKLLCHENAWLTNFFDPRLSPAIVNFGKFPTTKVNGRRSEGRDLMKFYMHPVSTTCRPIRRFMAEKSLKADEVLVDLMTGAHYQELAAGD
jgi:hypothetical protein